MMRFEDAERFLGRVAGLFLAVGWHDGVPPDVRGRLSTRGLFGADQPRRHVRDAIHLIVVECEVGRVFGIPEDVVVLGGPA